MERTILWNIFDESRAYSRQTPNMDDIYSKVYEVFPNVDGTVESLTSTFKAELKQYKRYRKTLKTMNSEARKDVEVPNGGKIVLTENPEVYEMEVDDEEPVSFGLKKGFFELSKYRQRCRTDEILESLKKFIDNEQLVADADSDDPMTITQLLGYLLHRVNYSENKKLSKVGLMLMHNKTLQQPQDFDLMDAVTLMHDMDLSKEKTRVIRQYLVKKGVYFPDTTELLKARKLLKPVIKPILDNKGVSVDYKTLVKMTSGSLLDAIEPSLNETYQEYSIEYKDGGDGSGSHAVWKSTKMKEAKGNIFQYALVPLRLYGLIGDEKIPLWENPSPNSPLWSRVSHIVREQESDPELLATVIPEIDRARNTLNEESCVVTSFRTGKTYQVQHKIHDTMNGAYCLLCEFQQHASIIKTGFPITSNYNQTWDISQKLVDRDGVVATAPYDYATRLGVTQKPITSSDQLSICITHSYINITNWFLKVLARMNCSYECWIEKQDFRGEHIRRATARVQDMLEDATGLRINRVGGTLSKCGGSTDGNTGRRFFEYKTLKHVLSCVPEKYAATVTALHQNLSCILRIISSTEYVNLDAYKQLTESTSLLLAEKLKWVNINYTLHGVLHHSHELIHRNRSQSLGSLSEEALESNNKYIRNYLEHFTRKNDPVNQLEDVIGRLLERSDPFININRLKYRPTKLCTICGSKKHSTKTHNKAMTFNVYDQIVHDILIDIEAFQ